MSLSTFSPRNAVLLLIIVVIATLRLLSFIDMGPLTYFTPLGAMALFGAAYFSGHVKPYLFPLLTLFISDLILSFTLFAEFRTGLLYSGWYWTYLAFALMTVAGKLILKKVTITRIILATITATLIHWLVSDIGACVVENKLTLPFYLNRLVTAIPYELRFLGGTAFFSAVMFGIFELAQKKYTFLKPVKANN
ncbi:hypothetical protein HB364_02625 [Pseudoflavitalea sp. X16]|uniref:DUF6580 family putative transport protein n=1 Tax=Paraflavitalea devenefica TaxID=2716334 RepID=UPI00141F13EB|nr:DUF6580 family putative transport protein [Paraflavitalea devenefica]NII23959.1 hypothetical protein [Paraflavitalea devenefica]